MWTVYQAFLRQSDGMQIIHRTESVEKLEYY